MSNKGDRLPLNSQLFRTTTKGGAPAGILSGGQAPEVKGQDIRDAHAQQSPQNNGWETAFVLSQEAASSFGRFTEAHDNDSGRLAIVLDKHVLSAPSIKSKITDNGVIEGLSGQEEAVDLALNLKAGSLPASVDFLEQREVGASLGSDSIKEGPQRPGRRAGWWSADADLLQAQRDQCGVGTGSQRPDSVGGVELFQRGPDAARHRGRDFDRRYGGRLERAHFRANTRRAEGRQGGARGGGSGLQQGVPDHHRYARDHGGLVRLLFLFGTGPVQGFAVTLVIGLVANVFTAVFVSRTIFRWSWAARSNW